MQKVLNLKRFVSNYHKRYPVRFKCDVWSGPGGIIIFILKIPGKNKQIAGNISVPGVPPVFTCAGWDMGQ